MTKGELIQAINEFIANEDDTNKDESYGTNKDESESVMERFKSFLIESKLL